MKLIEKQVKVWIMAGEDIDEIAQKIRARFVNHSRV